MHAANLCINTHILCNKHLLNSDFKTTVGIRHKLLRDDAVPSIFK